MALFDMGVERLWYVLSEGSWQLAVARAVYRT
jgi:hypothetical protein